MGSSSSVIIWLKNDLRISDNPAFIYALNNNLDPIPVFIWSSQIENPWELGSASRLWLYHSLSSLQKELKDLGLDLILRRGDSEEVLTQLIQESGAQQVIWNRRYEPKLLKHDKEVEIRLNKLGCKTMILNGSLLLDPEMIKNQQGTPFKVFTPFYKNVLKILENNLEQEYPKQLAKISKLVKSKQEIKSLDLNELNLLETQSQWQKNWQRKMLKYVTIGSQAANTNLTNFIPRGATKYQELRDRPDLLGTSKLASHLHFGEISPFRIWQEAQGHESFLRQLIWREFAYYIMFHFPHSTETNLKKEFDKFPWQKNARYLQAWQQGQTGYPIVDAGMRELWETGWMHNRVRMIVGSFLIKDLLIHWQEGAKWFWETLFDADLANNSMGWQWVAGSGVDASPFFRIFNPMTQGEKFDPNGDYVRKWCPELAQLPNEWIHKPFAAPPLILAAAGLNLGQNYPLPLVNHDAARKEALAGLALTKN